MRLEPSAADVRGHSGGPPDRSAHLTAPARPVSLLVDGAVRLGPVRAGTFVAAVSVLLIGRGDLGMALVLLVITAGAQPATVVAAAGTFVAVAARWATTSIPAVAGAQAVVGPALYVGRPLAVAGSVLCAVAMLATARRGHLWVVAGPAAALVVFGPSPAGGLLDACLWLVGLAGGFGLARLVAVHVPARLARPAAAISGVAAAATAVIGG